MENVLFADATTAQVFYRRNQHIVDAVIKAHDFCLQLLNDARGNTKGQAPTVIWLLAASCLKEYEEIFLLCGNGFGTGAIKLLRPFYERVTTLSYLAQNPQFVADFVDYSDIHWHKLLMEAENIHSESFKLPKEMREQIEKNYEKHKERFREDRCPECKRRPPTYWATLDIMTMASSISEDLRRLCASAYLVPTFHLHTSFWGIRNSIEDEPGKEMQFLSHTIQQKTAQEAFEHAYMLLVQVMDVLNVYFNRDKEAEIRDLTNLFVKAFELDSQLSEPEKSSPESI